MLKIFKGLKKWWSEVGVKYRNQEKNVRLKMAMLPRQ